jgi:hypothetical protein
VSIRCSRLERGDLQRRDLPAIQPVADTPTSTPVGRRSYSRPPERAAGQRYEVPATYLHLVWGRVVPDIPDFCRELVAALAEE